MKDQNNNHNQNTNLNQHQNQNVNSEHSYLEEEVRRRVARHLAGVYLALAREQLRLARVKRRRRGAANMCDRLQEVWAKELALDRSRNLKAKLTAIGKEIWGC